MLKISDLHKAMTCLGISLSFDQIRKLEKSGIILTTHNPKSHHREFTQEQFDRSVKNLLLYYFNTPIEEIKSGDIEVIKARIKKIKSAVKVLS